MQWALTRRPPKYREMLRRIAQDPVAQTVQFQLLMRLFIMFGQKLCSVDEACLAAVPESGAGSDGAAGAGMLGPILAFRGEIEAQGRGSLQPRIVVWLVRRHLQVVSDLARMIRHQRHLLQQRLRTFMHMAVASFESIGAGCAASLRLPGDGRAVAGQRSRAQPVQV